MPKSGDLTSVPAFQPGDSCQFHALTDNHPSMLKVKMSQSKGGHDKIANFTLQFKQIKMNDKHMGNLKSFSKGLHFFGAV